MKHNSHKLNARLSPSIKHWLFAALTLIASTSVVAAPDNDPTTYVDSVHSWGAWELDIEPAAGGIQPPTTQPLRARSTKVSLRTNSISALSPSAPKAISIPEPKPVPVTPPTTPPIGGPADGLF